MFTSQLLLFADILKSCLINYVGCDLIAQNSF